MTKRIIIGLNIIWTVAVAVFMLICFFPWIHSTDGITKEMSYTASETEVYVADNIFDHAVIYKLGNDGSKKEILIGRNNDMIRDYRVSTVSYEQSLFALFFYDTVYEGRTTTAYRIARLDDDMRIAQISDSLVLGSEIRVTFLSVDDSDIYISAVNTSGSEAYVYRVSQEAMSDVTTKSGLHFSDVKGKVSGDNSSEKTMEEEEKISEIKPFIFEVADTGRVYSDCAYEPGDLHLQYDSDKMDDFFSVPSRVETAYGQLHITGIEFNRMRGIEIAAIIIIWALGIPVIIIITVILKGRNRVVYSGVVMEFALIFLFGMAIFGMVQSATELSEREHANFMEYIMNDAFSNLNIDTNAFNLSEKGSARENILQSFYTSDLYENMYTELADMSTLPKENWKITGMAVIDRESGEVLVSNDRRNRIQMSRLYGKEASSFARISNAGSSIRTRKFQSDDKECEIFVRSLDNIGMSDCSLVGVVWYQDSVKNAVTLYNKYIKRAMIGFVIATIAIILLLILENRDMHAVAKMLKLLAEGRGVITSPVVRGKDLVAMKNSTFEIEKNITSINRSKYQIFEAYYRFAPKSIESMLDKDSITEVEIGDIADVTGTVAIFSMKERYRTDEETLANMNHTFEIMEQFREEHDGIYITNNETLSRARYLFLKDNKESMAFGEDVLESMREWKKHEFVDTLIFLHYTTFSYGICGTETQSMALLSSREIERISSFAEWLRKLKVSMVVTKAVLERESQYDDVRYLGFIKTELDDHLELYEVLNAQGKRMADVKKNTKTAFEEAIRLFYDKDFYLARNAFTEILREAPEDGITKWYLFECETRLNGNAEDIFTGALHL